MKKIIKSLISLSMTFPVFVFAAGKDLKYLASLVADYLNIGLSLIIGLAIVTFVWNVYRYFFTEKERTEAGLYVMYSVIGFFLILSFWGIVALVRNSLNLDDRAPVFQLGTFNVGGGGNGGTNNIGNTAPGNKIIPNVGPVTGNDPIKGPVTGNDPIKGPTTGNNP